MSSLILGWSNGYTSTLCLVGDEATPTHEPMPTDEATPIDETTSTKKDRHREL